MTIVEKSVPLEVLGLHEGDSLVGFRIVGGEIVFHIAAADASPTTNPDPVGTRLGDWGRKWAGSLALASDESRESLRANAMEAKFGS